MRERLPLVLNVLTWLVAVALAAVVLVTWARRFSYPYGLEWMEGGMLAHAWWLLRGEPLYVPPNPEFVPYLYPPAYSALVAALGKVVGLSLPLARAVSIGGTVAAVLAMSTSLRRGGAPWVVTVACGALFLATWPASGTFMDLARPDALALALLGWSVAAALDGRRGTVEASGLLLAAAFMAKHNLALFGLPLALGLLARSGWREAARFAVASAVPALLMTGLVQWRTGGEFLVYLLAVPLSHPTAGNLDRLMWAPRELGTPLPVVFGMLGLGAVVASLGQLRSVPRWLLAFGPVSAGMLLGWAGTYSGKYGAEAMALRIPAGVALFAIGALPVTLALWVTDAARQRLAGQLVQVRWRWVMVAGLVVTSVGMALMMRAHIGGFLNVYLPAHWVVVWAFGEVLRELAASGDARLRTLVPAAALAQLMWAGALLTPDRWVPTAADRAANDRIVEQLRGVEGPVLSPWAAWLPTYAGHEPSLHYMGLWDLEYLGGPYEPARGPVFDAVRANRWSVVVAGNQKFPYDLPSSYEVDVQLYTDEERGADKVGMPVVGYPVRPERLLVPKR